MRYVNAVIIAVVVTAALFFTMRALIESGDATIDDSPERRVLEFVEVERDQSVEKKQRKPKKLSYMDARALESLPGEIESLEAEQAEIHLRIAEPSFYQRPDSETAPVHARLTEIEAALLLKYDRWETLEALQSGE